MKRVAVAIVLALLAAAAVRPASAAVAAGPPARAAARAVATTVRKVILDPSPAAEVLAAWKRRDRDPRAAGPTAAGLAYRTLRLHLGRQSGCLVTERELRRALANPDSGACGFGLHPAWEARASLDSLVRGIRAERSAVAARVATRAGRYVPDAAAWGDSSAAGGAAGGAADRRLPAIRIWFVLASEYTFDAITLDEDADGRATPLVIVNLTDVLGYGTHTSERLAVLEHVLAHETFHALLRDVQRRSAGWRAFLGGHPRGALAHIARVMLDEGVAHFVDWKDRPGADTLFTPVPGPREQFAFTQLARVAQWLPGSRPWSPEWEEALQMASTGPLWSKYGAISGMFAASRIERALGHEALVRAVGEGPPAFLRLYGDLAARDSTWKAMPPELMKLE